VPSGPVLNVLEALDHPQAREYKAVRKIKFRDEAIDVLATPIWFDDQLEPPLADPPALGEHTESVLRELLKYDASKVNALIDSGAVEAYGKSAGRAAAKT